MYIYICIEIYVLQQSYPETIILGITKKFSQGISTEHVISGTYNYNLCSTVIVDKLLGCPSIDKSTWLQLQR